VSRRGKNWWQYNWEIANQYKEIEKPVSVIKKGLTFFDRHIEKTSVKMMPLGLMVEALGHKGRTVDYLSNTVYKKTWTLLREIVRYHNTIDIRQVQLIRKCIRRIICKECFFSPFLIKLIIFLLNCF